MDKTATYGDKLPVVPVADVPHWPASKCIYCVIAQTVQWPVGVKKVKEPRAGIEKSALYRIAGDNSISQPPDRLIVQASNAVGLVRIAMAKRWVQSLPDDTPMAELKADALYEALSQPITTRILEARDSFELRHVKSLLDAEGIPAYTFNDSGQIDYGNTEVIVTTAFATEPVFPEEIAGILDYLPEWSPQVYGGDRRKPR